MISNEDAMAYARLVARPESAGKNLVMVIPSFAERYLSTILFERLELERHI